jgi:hypothetical protein
MFTESDSEYLIVDENLEILGDNKKYEHKYCEYEVSKIISNIKGKMAIQLSIPEIEPLNVFKLMEAPYMAKLLKEERYDEFMEHLKQSEVEIANKIIELVDKANKK